MKRITSLFLSLTLALLPVFSFSGCGEKQEASSEKGSGPVAEEVNYEENYQKAVQLLSEGKYEESYVLFYAAQGFGDSEKYLSRFEVFYDKEIYDSVDYKYEHYYENGLLVKYVPATEPGEEWTIEYFYNEKGERIKEVDTHIVEQGPVKKSVYTVEYTYDDYGNVVQERAVDSVDGEVTEQITRYEYQYDEAGRMTKKTWEDGATQEYFYDEKGNCVRTVRESEESGRWEQLSTYDEKGNIIRSVSYQDGEQDYLTEQTYDERGNLIKSTTHTWQNHTQGRELVYDGSGTMIKHSSLWNDKVVSVSEFILNEYGLVIRTEDKNLREDGTWETSQTTTAYEGIHVVYHGE